MQFKSKIKQISKFKTKPKMEIENTRKKTSDYFVALLVIAVLVQLGLIIYSLIQL
ncbi:hypothetical protein [Neotamlana laminarinivorans]|uniref:Uncharacterized protein n=1 Tax=Neotamlana laminarinivorans TaxID=2883124 RepID=A0A9X1I162_9FLAO|nr:hypothetical protein [Tamlana laminarinivorans]MCB4799909.1 hypothetical protein [Tamlana laminarinivorans]